VVRLREARSGDDKFLLGGESLDQKARSPLKGFTIGRMRADRETTSSPAIPDSRGVVIIVRSQGNYDY